RGATRGGCCGLSARPRRWRGCRRTSARRRIPGRSTARRRATRALDAQSRVRPPRNYDREDFRSFSASTQSSKSAPCEPPRSRYRWYARTRMSSSVTSGGAAGGITGPAASPLGFFVVRLRGVEGVGEFEDVFFAIATFQPILLLFGRVAIVKPGLGGVGIPADFPETFLIFRKKLDLANPLRALPGVELGRDHPAWSAVLARERCSLPRMHQQHVVFHRAGEWKVRGVRNVGAGHEVVTRAQHVRGIGTRHCALGNRAEAHALPVIVEAAPGRDAVEVAGVFDLGQRQELVPGEGERVLALAADLQPPVLQIHRRLFAEVEHGPVLHLVLSDGKLRHAFAVARSGSLRRLSPELHVDAFVERDLPADVLFAAGDQIGFGYSTHLNGTDVSR